MADGGLLGCVLNLAIAMLVAWFTAWVYSRRERDRLRDVWRQERLRTSLDSLRECVDRLAQGLTLFMSLTQGKAKAAESLFEASLEGLVDSLRGAASVYVIAGAIGDPKLVEASKALDKASRRAVMGDTKALSEVMDLSSVMLQRCDELLEEAVARKGKRWWGRS